MGRILVVANQTVVGSELLAEVERLKRVDPDVELTVLVPATEPKDQPVNDHGQPLHHDLGRKQANERLVHALTAFRKIGASVEGSVGPADPMQAVQEAMTHGNFDSIVVSTLPVGVSKWLNMDLPHRLERRFGLPVEHVVGSADSSDMVTLTSDAVSVLLVEDQPADVELTRQALSRIELRVDMTVSANGQEALEHLRTLNGGGSAIDLVLLDLNMPVLDGHQFLARLDEEFGVEHFNVVILTTSTSDADRQRAHELGAAAYVVKDPDFDSFRDTLASLVTEVAGAAGT